ncbi:hypothetical protein FRC11_004052 [Ceratobasidium sp. 423]|nr:hypothetical protein FRC11_004052 [Ceratobasidium sp. 423]
MAVTEIIWDIGGGIKEETRIPLGVPTLLRAPDSGHTSVVFLVLFQCNNYRDASCGLSSYPLDHTNPTMNFLEAYASYPAQNSANAFALFGAAQSPRETSKAYRAAGAYSQPEFDTPANRSNRPSTLNHGRSSLDSKSEKYTYASSYESRTSRRGWLSRRLNALKRLF